MSGGVADPRLLVVSVNRERMPYPVAPLGAAYVARAARDAGADVRVADLCFSEDPAADLASAIREHRPDAIGVSIRNLDTATFPRATSSLPYLRALWPTLAASGAPVVLGGSGFSVAPGPMLQALGAEWGVRGEGEIPIGSIIGCLRDGRPLSEAAGVMRRTAGGVVENSSPATSMAGSPAPDRSSLDNARYWRDGGMANVQTKRGCSFRCAYCSYPVLEGRSFRMRRPADVVDEIETIVGTLGVDYVFFVDSIFNVPVRHASEICEEILRRNVKVRWSCYLTPAEADEAIVDLMARAGCREMEWGVDAGSDTQLRALRKSFGVEQVRRVARACRDRGVAFSCDLIVGAPGETEASLVETFDLMDEIAPNAVICMMGVRLYAGTESERAARADGTIAADADLLEPTFAFSHELPSERTLELVGARAAADPRWIVPGIGASVSPEVLQRLRRMGKGGALWELAASLQRSRVSSPRPAEGA